MSAGEQTLGLPEAIAMPHPGASGGRLRRQIRQRRRGFVPYLLLSPLTLLIAAFVAYPVGSVVYYSFQNYNPLEPYFNGFAGLGNYSKLLHDTLFWSSLEFAAKWVIVEVALQLVLGLILALIVNQAFRWRGLARALVFAPWAVSGVLTTTIWLLIYDPQAGIIQYLSNVGLAPNGFAILADTHTVFWGAIVAELWRGVPFFAIILLADLQTIPKELLEAANVDGASAWDRFRYVVLPHLRDAIMLSALLRCVWEFNNVDLLFTLTNGGPGTETTTLPLYVAQQAINDHNFGYGSALTMAGFLVLLVFSLIYLKLSKFGASTGYR
jgi:multiple sugar transport system permease protein